MIQRYLLLALIVYPLGGCSSHPEESEKPVVEVSVARAELADVQHSLTAPASIFAREQANVNSRITAPIRKLLVRKGARVAEGELLAVMDNRDLLAQNDEAQAAVVDAEAQLEKVTAGTLPADIERAKGQVEIARAALEQAEKFYERRQQLFNEGAIPQRELTLSQTELAQARSNYTVASRTLELLLGQSKEQDIRIARSRLVQARARASFASAQVAFAEIRSPFSGFVTEQFQWPGDMAKPDSPILTLMDLNVVVARGQVPESEVSGVRKGESCVFTPADGAGQFEGRVSVVNHAVDPARRTVETWCEIPNTSGVLRAGAFGSLTIVTGMTSNRIVVPLPAVQFVEGTQKGSVWVVGDKQVAAKKEVETGEVFAGKVEITAGLKVGDSVITEGGYGLPEGTAVRLKERSQR
jgi:HlyD family secretion protein